MLGDVKLEILATPGHTPESICVVVYEHADDEALRRAHGRHVVRRRRRSARPARVGGPASPPTCSAARCTTRCTRSCSPPARRHTRVPGPRRRVVVRTSSCRPRPAPRSASSEASTHARDRSTRTSSFTVVTEAQPSRPHYFEFDATQQPASFVSCSTGKRPASAIGEVIARQIRARCCSMPRAMPTRGRALEGRGQCGTQGRFAEWAATVLAPDADIVLVGDPATAREAKVRLARIGFDRVVGRLDDLSAVLATTGLSEERAHPDVGQPARSVGSSGAPAVDVRAAVGDWGGHAPRSRRDPAASSEGFHRRSRSDESRGPLLRERLPLINRHESAHSGHGVHGCVRPQGRVPRMGRRWSSRRDRGPDTAWPVARPSLVSPGRAPRRHSWTRAGSAACSTFGSRTNTQTGRNTPPATLIPMGQVLRQRDKRPSSQPHDRRRLPVRRTSGPVRHRHALRAGGWNSSRTSLAGCRRGRPLGCPW